MKQVFIKFFFLTSTMYSVQVTAQDVFNEKGYVLSFESNTTAFDPVFKKKMITAFFKVYPRLAREFNPKTIKKVAFVIDTAYKGVAATANGTVIFNPAYLASHPADIDVVTHEVMHIVQDYGQSKGPGWLTEGIADYARYKFGVENSAAFWSLPDLKPTHQYQDGYRITARFLAWIEVKVKKGVVKAVDKSLRDHTYEDSIWGKLTGKDLDTLWLAYIKNPSLV